MKEETLDIVGDSDFFIPVSMEELLFLKMVIVFWRSLPVVRKREGDCSDTILEKIEEKESRVLKYLLQRSSDSSFYVLGRKETVN